MRIISIPRKKDKVFWESWSISTKGKRLSAKAEDNWSIRFTRVVCTQAVMETGHCGRAFRDISKGIIKQMS